MRQPRQNKALKLFISTALLIFLLAYYNGAFKEHRVEDTSSITISAAAQNHILYGDQRGGGHKYGANKPCKSEFPKSWNDEDIISSITKIAANDNNKWKQQGNGYYVTESYNGNTKIRVVMGKKRQHIITAYPINTTRNPCPPKKTGDYND
ncbi:MAG: RhsD protein [Alphaproteobacteria bacterium]|nr:MAG: RhsD protein [Alphaproteobacteria bacterium]